MGDTQEQRTAEAESEKKPGGSRLIIIILGFVILLAVIGVVAMKMMGGGGDEEALTAPVVKMEEPGYMYKFPAPFTGNLAPPDNEFIFSATITLEIKEMGGAKEADALNEMGIGADTENKRNKMPYIRKIILEEISSKTRLEITSTTGRVRIGNTIKNNLNNILEKGQIKEVFLEIFVN